MSTSAHFAAVASSVSVRPSTLATIGETTNRLIEACSSTARSMLPRVCKKTQVKRLRRHVREEQPDGLLVERSPSVQTTNGRCHRPRTEGASPISCTGGTRSYASTPTLRSTEARPQSEALCPYSRFHRRCATSARRGEGWASARAGAREGRALPGRIHYLRSQNRRSQRRHTGVDLEGRGGR